MVQSNQWFYILTPLSRSNFIWIVSTRKKQNVCCAMDHLLLSSIMSYQTKGMKSTWLRQQASLQPVMNQLPPLFPAQAIQVVRMTVLAVVVWCNRFTRFLLLVYNHQILLHNLLIIWQISKIPFFIGCKFSNIVSYRWTTRFVFVSMI